MKLNNKIQTKTHEGGRATQANTVQMLRRSVLSCLLWEKEYYEEGKDIAQRIVDLALSAPAEIVHALAVEARQRFNLRHVPLLLLATRPNADAIFNTISRADELTELLAIYWRNGKRPIPAQMKKGLARAFTKFDEYALAKYNRDGAIKLRDVLFLCHAKPQTKAQDALWKRLINNELKVPDTWEVALSGGANKKETFERLINEGKLGYLALLRNLRNMEQSGVDASVVRAAITARKGGAERVLPFRFVAAARHAPRYEKELDASMMHAVEALPRLRGTTVVLIDVSGSMDRPLSAKSDMTRMDAAAALGSIIQSDDLRVFTFSSDVVEVPARRGMAGVDAVIRSQKHSSTRLGEALTHINSKVEYDRLITITDEQTSDRVVAPTGRYNYLINVASYRNGISYGNRWTHIDGFSENVITFIHEAEMEG